MTWQDDLRACVQALPREFTLNDIYRFSAFLQRRHRSHRHVPDQIREELQALRDAGEIQFLGGRKNPKYRSNLARSSNWPIKVGSTTDRVTLANKLGLEGVEAINRGMFKPKFGNPFGADLMLFHQTRGNAYGDRISPGEELIFVGQGKAEGGNQKLDSYNRYLAEHIERGINVHLFVQSDPTSANLRYEGPVFCDRAEYVYRESESRSVLEFHLEPLGGPLGELNFGKDFQEILDEPLQPHTVQRSTRLSKRRRQVRNRAFSEHIRVQYGKKCAVCGDPLVQGTFQDLQGAHVRAFAAGGPDARNNGICLCARHHWAFDHGVFSISNSYSVLMPPNYEDPHGELEPNGLISLPENADLAPHPQYLEWHRRTWSLNPT